MNVSSAPGGLPLAGHAPWLLRDRLGYLEELRDHGPAVWIRLGRQRVLVLNDHRPVRELLTRRAGDFGLSPHFRVMKRIVGNGLLVTDGPFHRRQRKIMLPVLAQSRMPGYADAMSALTEQRLAHWRPGQQLDVDREFTHLATETAVRCLFGADVTGRELDLVVAALPDLMAWAGTHGTDPTGLLARLPLPLNRRFRRGMSDLTALVTSLVDRRRDASEDDLLGALLAARDPDTGEPLPDQQVHDEIMTFLTAAVESVSRTLTWAVHELSAHPEVRVALHAEVDGRLAGRPATAADLPHLPLTRRILTEVLRLYPPGYLISRTATRDTLLGDGIAVPAGTMVMFSYYALQRDPRHFPEPAAFRPDRWAAFAEGACPAFLPFGLGAHGCLGESFAWTEMAIVLASVAARWELRASAPVPPKPVAAFSLTLTDSRVTLTPRTESHVTA
ncbi:cytochrome P450 [Streptomyces acidiscabies]|uniref:Cytochrome P450 n=1 Tax=Streptomyces acidiscabies TaxID=42234 RepID=A0A0L0K7K3_9ACTN|nr:cytochrome P450 [Streptomyces acidiscabies]KND33610.1 cytochrome P450 [Streptomyces acidiscabies]